MLEQAERQEKREQREQKSQRANALTVTDIKIDSKIRFRIDKRLADMIKVEIDCTYREFTIALLKFHKVVKNFYDKATNTFNVGLYPKFRQYFPDQSKITSTDIKAFLLKEPLY